MSKTARAVYAPVTRLTTHYLQSHFGLNTCFSIGEYMNMCMSLFVFSFSLFFVSVPCDRLSWPFGQLLSNISNISQMVQDRDIVTIERYTIYRILSYRLLN